MFLGTLVYAFVLGLSFAGPTSSPSSTAPSASPASVPTLPFPPAQTPAPR